MEEFKPNLSMKGLSFFFFFRNKHTHKEKGDSSNTKIHHKLHSKIMVTEYLSYMQN